MSDTTYKLLGVDPGTNLLGYAVIEIDHTDLRLLDLGVITLRGFDTHQTKLKEIFLQLQEVIETYLPQQMAIEAPFYGKNVQSMLKLGRAQGVAIAAGITMGLDIAEYSPKKVKQAVTGNGNASKEQVAAMLAHLFHVKRLENTLDATDALAVAFCHYLQASRPDSGRTKTSWKQFLTDNPTRIKKSG